MDAVCIDRQIYMLVPDGCEWEDIELYRNLDDAIKRMLRWAVFDAGNVLMYGKPLTRWSAHVEEFCLCANAPDFKHTKSYVVMDGFKDWLQLHALNQQKDLLEVLNALKDDPLSIRDACVVVRE